MSHNRTAIWTCTLSTFLVNADNASLNLALPSASRDIGASPSQGQWIINAYLLALATCVTVAGTLGDRFGKKRILMMGLTLYMAGSLVSAAAQSAPALITARAIAGIGAAALVPLSLAIMRELSATPKEVTANTALWGAVVGAGMAAGPLFGGLATSATSWRVVPVINCVLALLFLICTTRLIPSRRASSGEPFDWRGQGMLILFMISLIYGLISFGGDMPVVVGLTCLATAGTAGAVFIRHIHVAPDPLISPDALRSKPFTFSLVSAVANYMCVGGSIYASSLLLQEVAGTTAFTAGLLVVPLAIGVGVGGHVSRRVMNRRGPGAALELAGHLLVVGPTLAVTGVMLGGPAALPILVPASLLISGIGMGLANTPTNVLSLSGLPAAQSGRAGAFASASRQLGQTLGVAAIGVLLATLNLHRTSHVASVAAPWLVLAAAGSIVLLIGRNLRHHGATTEARAALCPSSGPPTGAGSGDQQATGESLDDPQGDQPDPAHTLPRLSQPAKGR